MITGFGPDHYVPILKAKRAEKKALQNLTHAAQVRITPLLEIVEMNGQKALAAHLKTAFDGMAASVQTFPRYFLDAHEIESTGVAGATAAFNSAATIGHPFTPVTGILRSVDIAPALAHSQHGIAVRLTVQEFESGHLQQDLLQWIATHKLVPEQVDLIVDLGAVDDMIVPGIAALTTAFLADVPLQTRWRTLTVSGCAFPQSMGGVGRNSHMFVERAEWLAWKNNLHAQRTGLARLPSFSDYAIQHPTGVEGFDPRYMQISASIRYTLPDHWLLIKGESTDKVPADQQFRQLAHQLVYGHLSGNFAGEKHCGGCLGAKNAAHGAPKLGSAEVWRRLGTIHHLVRAVDELTSLPWP